MERVEGQSAMQVTILGAALGGIRGKLMEARNVSSPSPRRDLLAEKLISFNENGKRLLPKVNVAT